MVENGKELADWLGIDFPEGTPEDRPVVLELRDRLVQDLYKLSAAVLEEDPEAASHRRRPGRVLPQMLRGSSRFTPLPLGFIIQEPDRPSGST